MGMTTFISSRIESTVIVHIGGIMRDLFVREGRGNYTKSMEVLLSSARRQQAGFATLWVVGIVDMLNLALLALLVSNYGGAQIIELNSWTRCHILPAKRRSTVKPPKVALLGRSSPKKYSCL